MNYKNLIKYTIGLPILIICSIVLILVAIPILIVELLAEGVGFIIDGEAYFSHFVSLGMIRDVWSNWKPIE